jgi:TATA-binding protein-associated factor Taf7
MDAYVCLKESDVVIADGDEESSSEDDDDDDDDESGDDSDSHDEEQGEATQDPGTDHLETKPDLLMGDSVVQRKLDEQVTLYPQPCAAWTIHMLKPRTLSTLKQRNS